MSSLHKACQNNDFAAVCLDLQQGTSRINDPWSERKLTPLMLACGSGHAAIARELVARQALTDLQDSEGRTALHHACLASSAECCRALLKARATTDLPDEYGWGPLQLAGGRAAELVKGASEVVVLLSQYPSCPPPPIHRQIDRQNMDGGWEPPGTVGDWGEGSAPPHIPLPPPPSLPQTMAPPSTYQPFTPPPPPAPPAVYYPPVPITSPGASSPSEPPPSIYICPITQEVMNDPVFASDGFTYERSAIEGWLARHSTSPLTNNQLQSNHVVPNHSLRSAILEWKEKAR